MTERPMEQLVERARRLAAMDVTGKVVAAAGSVVRVRGMAAVVGQPVNLWTGPEACPIPAEVVGMEGDELLLMALGSFEGLGATCVASAMSADPMVPVGHWMLGRVFDSLGRPMDGRPIPQDSARRSLRGAPPRPLDRARISRVFGTGIRAVDAMVSVGRGQRVGIFAGAGVGKSTVLQMIARNNDADVCVLALVGERGREVRDYLEDALGAGRERTVVVACTGDEAPLARIRASLLATTIAEHFRSSALNVLLLFDSLTRYAMALREVGLATGELPSSKGYPPSVFLEIARLLERAGNDSRGCLTGVYSVLVEGDDLADPVADACRALLDGHIVLSREIANAGILPAVDVLGSKSRVMDQIVPRDHADAARRIGALLAIHRQAEDLIRIGAYQPGSDPKIDAARRLVPDFEQFLTQAPDAASSFEQAAGDLMALAAKHFGSGRRAA